MQPEAFRWKGGTNTDEWFDRMRPNWGKGYRWSLSWVKRMTAGPRRSPDIFCVVVTKRPLTVCEKWTRLRSLEPNIQDVLETVATRWSAVCLHHRKMKWNDDKPYSRAQWSYVSNLGGWWEEGGQKPTLVIEYFSLFVAVTKERERVSKDASSKKLLKDVHSVHTWIKIERNACLLMEEKFQGLRKSYSERFVQWKGKLW